MLSYPTGLSFLGNAIVTPPSFRFPHRCRCCHPRRAAKSTTRFQNDCRGKFAQGTPMLPGLEGGGGFTEPDPPPKTGGGDGRERGCWRPLTPNARCARQISVDWSIIISYRFMSGWAHNTRLPGLTQVEWDRHCEGWTQTIVCSTCLAQFVVEKREELARPKKHTKKRGGGIKGLASPKKKHLCHRGHHTPSHQKLLALFVFLACVLLKTCEG